MNVTVDPCARRGHLLLCCLHSLTFYRLMFLVVLCGLQAANATTIVVKIEAGQIIIAADSRQNRISADSNPSQKAYSDRGCKLVALGGIGVGIAGNMDYKREVSSDLISDWTASGDAQVAHALHKDDVRALAREWANRAASHYTVFYEAAPLRVKQLASVNSERVLVDAFFAGWEGDTPLLIWEKIVLDDTNFPKIVVREQILPRRDLAYTTNAITQELIEGNSDRMRNAVAEWTAMKEKVPKQEAAWRQLEYIVEKTGEYDNSVGGPVNILRIPLGSPVVWIQNATCQEKTF